MTLTMTTPPGTFAQLTVQVDRHGADVVVEPHGAVDLNTVHLLEAALRSAEGSAGAGVVLDLRWTSFLACCAVGPIAGIRRQLESTGRHLAVTGAVGVVRRVLRACDLREVLSDRGRPAGVLSTGVAEPNPTTPRPSRGPATRLPHVAGRRGSP